jgi:chemotaxis protein CheZ
MRKMMGYGTATTRDAEDLEALFDSIVLKNRECKAVAASSCDPSEMLINRIGLMTRILHDNVRKLGYDKTTQRATALIPNVYDRLDYVASLTRQAADRILNATEAAQPVIEKIGSESQTLANEWQKLLDCKLDVDQFRHLVNQTNDFLAGLPNKTTTTHAYLMEIINAQSSQEMSWQLIKQIVDITQQLEKQLLELLIANPPSSVDSGAYAELLSRPTIKPDNRTLAASDHDQVDELLASFGF